MLVRAARITDTTLGKRKILHVSSFAASPLPCAQTKHCKTQVFFYTSRTRNTVNYVGQRWCGGEPGVVGGIGRQPYNLRLQPKALRATHGLALGPAPGFKG